VKGFKKGTKEADLKKLHGDIISVRLVGAHAWLIFPTENACDAAFSTVSKAKLGTNQLLVDFCGSKSKQGNKTVQKAERPINPLELIVAALPRSVTQDKLKIIFPNAHNIKMITRFKDKNAMAFVQFANEVDARAAFEKGKSLKIGGVPVDVFYARFKNDVVKTSAATATKTQPEAKTDKKASTEAKKTAEPKKQQPQKKVAPQVEEESDDDEEDDEEEFESSEEGIEEEDDEEDEEE
jgi:hypothetical protein